MKFTVNRDTAVNSDIMQHSPAALAYWFTIILLHVGCATQTMKNPNTLIQSIGLLDFN